MAFEVGEKRGIKARTRLIDALFVNVRPTVAPLFFSFTFKPLPRGLTLIFLFLCNNSGLDSSAVRALVS